MENDDESTTSMRPHSDVYTDDAPTGKLPAAAISDVSGLLHAVDTNQNIIEPGAGALVLGSDTSLKDQHDGSNSELRLSEVHEKRSFLRNATQTDSFNVILDIYS